MSPSPSNSDMGEAARDPRMDCLLCPPTNNALAQAQADQDRANRMLVFLLDYMNINGHYVPFDQLMRIQFSDGSP